MVTIDCLDTRKLAQFWVAALGAEIIHEVDDGAMLVLSSEGNVDIGLQQVADALQIPIALGEQEPSTWNFRHVLAHNAVGIVQQDRSKAHV